MPRLLIIITLLFFCLNVYSQQSNTHDTSQIKAIIYSFMGSIIKKDSTKFYSLFHEDPIVWVGVYKKKSFEIEHQKNKESKNFFAENYKDFYKYISDKGLNEEKFYNVNIQNDESIASVIFDYSFWENNKKNNWGKESWGLIKVNNEWKITSVIFSLDYESINPEPKQ